MWAVVYGTAAGNFFTYFHQKAQCLSLREWLACECKKGVYAQYILSAEKKPVDKRISLPLRLCLLIILTISQCCSMFVIGNVPNINKQN